MCVYSAPVCVCVCATMANTSKMLLTPHQGDTFVAAAAAISDRHDISSFRYMLLCIGLLHTVCSEKKEIKVNVF